MGGDRDGWVGDRGGWVGDRSGWVVIGMDG